MKPWQKRIVLAAIALVVLGLLAWPKIKPGESAPAGPPRGGGGAASVTGYVVRPLMMEDAIRSTGSLEAAEAVDLAAEAAGRVTQVLFEEGSRVEAGQLLLTINDAELRARERQLQAQIELAETRERRQRQLLDIGGVSQDEYDGARSSLAVLEAELGLVRAQIERTEVRAPFSGVLGLRYVSPGAYVTPQTRIATLQALSPLRLAFSVPERYAAQVGAGSTVTFTTAGTNRAFRGEVYAVEPRVDLDTRTILLRALVPNPGGALLPGAFADVSLTVGEEPSALPVPTIAVVSELGGKRVFVVENGQARSRVVETGIRTEDAVQITRGVQAGDTVIVTGIQALRPGQNVEVTDLRESLTPLAPTFVMGE
jgi:membrane fusion protein (multidrug efflux system)